MKRIQKISSVLALLVAPLLLAGCGKDSSRNPVSPAADQLSASRATNPLDDLAALGRDGGRGRARVLFVHASPDAPAVDIYVGQNRRVKNLGYPENSSYRSVRPGTNDVKVNVAGTSTSVINAPVPFESRKAYTIFAVDRVANIAPLLLEDNLSRPAPGKAHVRFVHLSPDAPPVDVAVANGGMVVFGNKSFKQATDFTPLPAGKYDLEVRLAGTGTVVLPLPGIVLKAGKIYTVFAKGFVAGTGAQALGAQIIVNSDEIGNGVTMGQHRHGHDDDDEDRSRGRR